MASVAIGEPVAARIRVDASGATSIGQERARNEDQFLVANFARTMQVRSTSLVAGASQCLPGSAQGTLLVVADGMGGHGGGDVASALAVKTVAEYLCNVLPSREDAAPRTRQDSQPGVRQGLREAVTESERELRRAAEHGVGGARMGTTLTMAYAHFPRAYIAHVGDSRCYLWRAGTLRRLTRDHTLAELRHELGAAGEHLPSHHHILWNALGGGDESWAKPDILRVALAPGDALVLCSDGLTRHIDDKRIGAVLGETGCAGDACTRLVAAANAAGGRDNITVVVARFISAAS
jgi:protein phosphatase